MMLSGFCLHCGLILERNWKISCWSRGLVSSFFQKVVRVQYPEISILKRKMSLRPFSEWRKIIVGWKDFEVNTTHPNKEFLLFFLCHPPFYDSGFSSVFASSWRSQTTNSSSVWNEYGRPLPMWSTVPCQALFSTGLSFVQRRTMKVALRIGGCMIKKLCLAYTTLFIHFRHHFSDVC